MKQDNETVEVLSRLWDTKTAAYEAAGDPLYRLKNETRKDCAARLFSLSESARLEMKKRREIRDNRNVYRDKDGRRILRKIGKFHIRKFSFQPPYTSGNCNDTVIIGETSGVTIKQYPDYNVYSKSWHNSHGPAMVTQRTWTVPSDWYTRVYRRGLQEIDGLLTLDAHRIHNLNPAFEFFNATWAIKGRGHAYNTASGVIARFGRIAYHGKDVATATRGLVRKIEEAKNPITQATAEKLLDRVLSGGTIPEEIANLKIGLMESRMAGNCESGTINFAEKIGIDTSDKTKRITVSELWTRIKIAALCEKDMPLVKMAALAVLVAIRRNKNARRAIAA
jgi:hypothetical protein